ncbi:MAG: flagellar hook-length control protein FliK [Treponema sp.]|nr:flagellar hook-length control protein FliK [Treponema sp.]
MQAVQLQQIQPQMQNAPASQVAMGGEGSSFLDELKARIQETDSDHTLQKTEGAIQDETADNPPVAERSKDALAADENTSEKEIAKKDRNDADEEKEALDRSSEKDTDSLISSEMALLSRADTVSDEEAVTSQIADYTEDSTLSVEDFNWLTGSSDDAFSVDSEAAGMKGKAVSELSSAQTLSIDEPAAFLEALEKDPQSIKQLSELLLQKNAQLEGEAASSRSVNEGFDSVSGADAVSALGLSADAHKKAAAGTKEARKDKKNAFQLDVHDVRTKSAVSADSAKAGLRISDKKEFNAAYQRDAQQETQLTMELSSRVQQNITASDTQSASATGSTFQSMLSNTVQAHAPDFVRAGSVVLKDNNQGSINLILHPESLGNVKIHLSLSDKVITGQITVHSQEAYEAFRESIDTIKQAFAQSGFDTGSFDLNFASNNSFAQSGNGGEQNAPDSFRANATYGDFASVEVSAADGSQAPYEGAELYSVDVVA